MGLAQEPLFTGGNATNLLILQIERFATGVYYRFARQNDQSLAVTGSQVCEHPLRACLVS